MASSEELKELIKDDPLPFSPPHEMKDQKSAVVID